MQDIDTRRELTGTSVDDNTTLGRVMNSAEAGCSHLAAAIRRRDKEAIIVARLVTNLLVDGHLAYQRVDARLAAASKTLSATQGTALALLEEMMEDGMPDAMRSAAAPLRERLTALAPSAPHARQG